MSNSIATSLIGTTLNTQDSKRYSLVKWLENSQFDSQNEWLGRLTSVPHTNIIDFDSEELKAGNEINVIRNNGEIWRAQIIIPKTSSNTIDLPPSSYKKIRTKAMGTTKLICELTESMDITNPHPNNTEDEFETEKEVNNQNQLIILTNAANSLCNQSEKIKPDPESANSGETQDSKTCREQIDDTNQLSLETCENKNSLEQHNSCKDSIRALSDTEKNSNISCQSIDDLKTESKNVKTNSSISNQKEWQFLQTAINEAGLTDFYQTYNDLANSSSNMVTTNNQTLGSSSTIKQYSNGNQVISFANSLTNSPASPQNVVTVNDFNIETILQMQCELLDQQKELKTIELETMDHLRQLQQNINKLSNKFESFELSLQNQNNVIQQQNVSSNFNLINNSNGNNINGQTNNQENHNLNNLKAAKNVFTKLNTTIGQQLKLVDNELLKELNNITQSNINMPQTTTVSLLSPTSLLQNSSIMNHSNANVINHNYQKLHNSELSTTSNNKTSINNALIPLNSIQLLNTNDVKENGSSKNLKKT